jgi:glycosyltransferase 2 family protein
VSIKSIATYVISLSMAIVLLVLAFEKIELPEFISKTSEVAYIWVFFSIFLSLVSHWLRAYRWNILLEPFGYQLRTGRTFLAVMTGYLVNLAIPRLGEVTRCGVLKKNDGVSMSFSFGTVITERVIDLCILLIVIVFGFILEFDKIFGFFSQTLGFEEIYDRKWLIVAILATISTGLIIGFLIIRTFMLNNSNSELVNKLRKFTRDLMNGLFSLGKIKNIWGFILSTVGIWVLYFFMSYVIVFSIAETSELGLLTGLSILVAGALAMLVPVPGGIGAYHLTVSGVMALYGIKSKTGLFFATLLHSSQFVSILVVGGFCLLISVFISKNNIPNSPEIAD